MCPVSPRSSADSGMSGAENEEAKSRGDARRRTRRANATPMLEKDSSAPPPSFPHHHHVSPSTRKQTCLMVLLLLVSLLAVILLLALLGLYLKAHNSMDSPLSGAVNEDGEPIDEYSPENVEYLRKLIKRVNDDPGLGWKAKFNKFGVKNRSYGFKYTRNETEVRDYLAKIQRYFESDRMKNHLTEIESLPASSLPTSFDARLKWSHCPSISSVPNQGGCGSCYAVASMGVASDRACISSNGTFKAELSPQDVIGCCSVCGNCFGGDPLKALTYWVEEGIVSGGRDGCRPYEFDLQCGVPCSPGVFRQNEAVRSCKKKCQDIYYQNDYANDKRYASISYSMYPRSMTMDAAGTIREQVPTIIGHFNSTASTPLGIDEIRTILKKELFISGPFTMAFPVTEEFLHYSSGIFVPHPVGDFLSRVVYWHVVRVIGWGVDEGGKNHWLAVNSFGNHWGDNGVFKINTDSLEKFGLEYETALV